MNNFSAIYADISTVKNEKPTLVYMCSLINGCITLSVSDVLYMPNAL